MDLGYILLGLALAAALGGVVMLLLNRAALVARAATAEEARAGAERAESLARAEAQSQRAALEAATTRAAELAAKASELAARLEESARSHAQSIGAIEKGHEDELAALRTLHGQQLASAESINAERLQAVEAARDEIRRHMAQSEAQFKSVFESLAGQALKGTTEEFLKLATERLGTITAGSASELAKRQTAIDSLLQPIRESLVKTDKTLAEMENNRTGAYSTLMEQIRTMAISNIELRGETNKLARALSGAAGKGRYGEVQLRRVAELAGMIEHCDFSMQREQDRAIDEAAKRPDMTVLLPSGRMIAVDSKANIQAFIDSVDAKTDDEREALLDKFAKAVARQATELSRKNYASSAEFVVMFLPSDRFIEAAMIRIPTLLEDAARLNVILAGPAALIGLLRAVAVGFAEQKVSKEAARLRDLAQELHERFARVLELIEKVGDSAERTVKNYNELVGSIEGRLMPTLREFESAGGKSAAALPDPAPATLRTRVLDRSEAMPLLPGL